MLRRDLFRGSAVLAASFGLPQTANAYTASESDARERIKRAGLAGLAMERRDWEHDILAQAFLEVGEDDSVIRITTAAIFHPMPDAHRGGVFAACPPDPAMGGARYWHAGQITGDPRT